MKNDKYYANRGVRRNKKPLRNIIIYIQLCEKLNFPDLTGEYNKYKFKNLGYIAYSYKYQGDTFITFGGFITPDHLKEKLTKNQWCKFCQGERIFIIQRRIDGKNI